MKTRVADVYGWKVFKLADNGLMPFIQPIRKTYNLLGENDYRDFSGDRFLKQVMKAPETLICPIYRQHRRRYSWRYPMVRTLDSMLGFSMLPRIKDRGLQIMIHDLQSLNIVT